ncbi:MAG: UDP-N-acetylglucosamine 2-epimerase (non-hydrolyzing) [Acetobacteraceae bacterium]|nr:UDP-N-acetylglucosamine 2-epimerase (non-hydrolyzing) [Acetobacteraceae bacterium]
MRILVALGTRPEAIKLAPVVLALRARGAEPRVATTGQQEALAAEALAAFGLAPDVALDAPPAARGLSESVAAMLRGLAGVIAEASPGAVVVQGDTASCFAAAFAAFHAGVPVAHVEAGLRSRDLGNPFPEEGYRVAVDGIARWLFAPTAGAAANLSAEEARGARVLVTGNTGVDALLAMRAQVAAERCPVEVPEGRRLVVATLHRRESFGAVLAGLAEALAAIAARPDVVLALPLHPNPAACAPLRARLSGLPRVVLLEALPYPRMVRLLAAASLLLTDSGGLQEEVPALGLPVLVLREVTERPEAVAAGSALLAGTDPARIVALAQALLDDEPRRAAMAVPRFPYGDGQAAVRIAEALLGR